MSGKNSHAPKEKAVFTGKERAAAIIAAAVIPVPMAVTSVVSAERCLQWQGALALLFYGAICWGLGQLFGFLAKKAGKHLIYLVKIAFIFVGIGLVAGYETLFTEINTDSLAVFLMPIAVCLWYWFGYKVGAGQDPVPYTILGVYCVEAAILFPLCGNFEGELYHHEGRNVILIVSAVVTVLGTLIVNSRQLNKLSMRGKGDSNVLSSATKRFNTKTTLIFAGILLFFFFFASCGAELLWAGSKAVVRFFLYLISLLPIRKNGYEFKPDDWEISAANPGSEEDNLVGQIIVAAILLALFLLLLKPLIKGIKGLYLKIKAKLGKQVEAEEIPQYTDIYQESDRREFEKSSFKKAIRAFKREKDLTEKYRLGYKAFMIFIGEKTEQASPADTTRVHLQKGRKITNSPYLEAAVETYCKVRYDDYIAASEDIITIGNLLKSL